MAAVFLGGNVGVRVDAPSVALEVDGVVSANQFNLSGELSVSSLIVNESNIIPILTVLMQEGNWYLISQLNWMLEEPFLQIIWLYQN